jgi:DNA-directed RNA polymerase I, II, and III subunit RPABC2
MSDEEYEEAGQDEAAADEAGVTETEPGTEASDDDEDYGLDEDAAGTDEGTDTEEPADEYVDPQLEARPARQSTDPPTKKSNRSSVAVLIAPDERMTDNVLRRPEAAQVLATRAREIAEFATSFVDHEGLHDPVAIAYKELAARRCPLKVRRWVGTGPGQEEIYEEWRVNEMTLPPLTPPVVLGPIASAGAPPPPPAGAPSPPAAGAPRGPGAPPDEGPDEDPIRSLMQGLHQLTVMAARR